MRDKLRTFLSSTFPTLWAIRAILWADQSYLQTTGWMKCWKTGGRPLTPDGEPLPWMNYTVIEQFEKRLTKDLIVFEYGSGFSTLFFAARVKSVDSIEYDPEWFEILKKKIPSNVDVIFIPKDVNGNYCRAIQQSGKLYDVVIVDGRDRVNCVYKSIERLTGHGVIVLDDSDRERYKPAFEFIKSKGFKSLELTGLKPTGFEAYQTTIFYRADNCLDL